MSIRHSLARALVVVIVVSLTGSPVAGQQPPPPPPQPPRPAPAPGGGVPLPTKPVLDFNTTIRQDLELKAKNATQQVTTYIVGAGGGGVMQTQQATNQTNASVMGQIYIRDTWVTQLDKHIKDLEALRDNPDRLHDLTLELREAAKEVHDAYVNVLASERDVAAVAQRTRTVPEARYNAGMARAQEMEAKGDKAGADKLRRETHDSAYGLYLDRRQHFYEKLDEQPLLGLGERNLILPDEFLFQDLHGTRLSNAPNSEYVEIVKDYVDDAIEKAKAEKTRAAGINSVEGFREFGSPKYERQQRAAAAGGAVVGSDLPRQLVEAAKGGYEAVEGANAIANKVMDFGLNVVAGGAWVIPGIGPAVAAGAAAIQVIREGNDLVIAILDAEQARALGSLRGYTQVITAEDRVAAERGEFGLALTGALVEGVNVVRVARGPVVLGAADTAAAAGARAVDAPPPSVAGAATPPAAAPGAAAVNPPPPATAPRTAPRPGDAPPIHPDPPGAAQPNATPTAAANTSTTAGPRSSGALDETIATARQQAEKYGIDQTQIDKAAADARGNLPYLRNRLDNPAAEASRYLSGMADLDNVVQDALRRGVPKADVDAAVKRAIESGNRGYFSAFSDLRGELQMLEANAKGATVFIDDAFANDLAAFSPAVAPTTRVARESDDLVNLGTRLKLKAQGRLSDDLTPQELGLLADLQARGDEILDWHAFEPGAGASPIFRPDFFDDLKKAFPDGVPVPAGAPSHAPLPPRPGNAAPGIANDTPTVVDSKPAAGAPDDTPTFRDRQPDADNTPTVRGTQPPPDDTPTVLLGGQPRDAGSPPPTMNPGQTVIDANQTRIVPDQTVLTPNNTAAANSALDATRIEPPPSRGGAANPPPDETPTTILGGPPPAAASQPTSLNPGQTVIDPNQTRIVPDQTVLNPGGVARSVVAAGTVTGVAAGTSTASAAEPSVSVGLGVGTTAPRSLPGTVFIIRPRLSDERSSSSAHSGSNTGIVTTGVIDLVSQPGYLETGASTSPSDRDPLVQAMMVVMRVQVARRTAHAVPMSSPNPARATDVRFAAQRAWHFLTGLFERPALSSRIFRIIDGEPPAPLQVAGAVRPAGGAQPAGRSAGGVRAFLTSLGTSTGEAFEIQVLHDGPNPIDLTAEGLVVEPLKKAAQNEIQRQIAALANRNPITARLNAYCLEFVRQPPSAGTIFRIASPELQQRFAPMRSVLKAAQQMEALGLLRPDGGDPTAYFHSIRQWALWAKEQNFSMDSFGRAFVEHAKKNLVAAGQPWTSQIESAIRSRVPHRWNDIATVLKAAAAAP